MNKNYHNSRTSDDIDIKLGPVTNIEERKKITSKNMTMMSCQQIVTSLSFVRFMAIWKPDSGRIDTALTQLSNYCFD